MLEQIQINDQGMTVIPEGYRWCENCNALTPYRKGKGFGGSYYCEVCDSFKTGMIECPNCGCDESEDCIESYVVTKHLSGCHCKKEEDEDGYTSMYSHSDKVMREFERDYMRNHPNLSIYSSKEDWEYYAIRQSRLALLKNYKERNVCGCPRFTIFKNIHKIVIEGHSYPSMDCSNAYWWRYRVRCPVCGCIYENDDDSC